MMTFLIHGLGASEASFTYLTNNLADCRTIAYNSLQPLSKSIKDVQAAITTDEEYHLIGHSLGGVIAMHLAMNNPKVKSVTTIASPLGGSKAARFLKFIVIGAPVLADITPRAKHIMMLSSPVHCPVLSIISTTGGWSIFGEANDGTVELSSQRALPYAKKVEVYANHFEVLLSRHTLDAIKEFQCV